MRNVNLGFAIMMAVIALTAPPLASRADAQGRGCLPGVLKQRLAQISSKFGRPRIISTHRRGARIAGTGRRSYHASCRAVDFKPPSGKYRQVVAWLKSNHGGGVGTYSCGMHHIHIDNGPRVRYHHCVTASGRPTSKSRTARSRTSKRRTTVASGSRGRSAGRVAGRRAPTTRASGQPASKSFTALRHFEASKRSGG